jgi:glycosyltransferase involved in cell wall biosynthesis
LTLFILPVRNEAETILETSGNLFDWCRENIKEFKILFIDDNSKDETVSRIEGLNNYRIKVLKNQFDNGKGSTLKTGFVFSNLIYKMKDDDLVIFMDGDGQVPPENIPPFLEIMKLNGADVVIGNKRHIFSITNYSLQRSLVSVCYNLIIKILFGLQYQDTQCGLKIFKKKALDKVIDKVKSKRYAFDLELIIALREMRFRVADAPVTINNQKNSGSVSFGSMINTFMETVGIWNKKLQGYYR